MADQEQYEDGVEEFSAPKSNKVTMIIVAACVALIVGAGGFFFAGVGGSSAQAKEAEVELSGPPVLVAFDPYIVNLNEPGAGRYLKLTVEYEVAGDKSKEALVSRTAPIRHKALSHLSGLNFGQTQGSQSKTKIQAKLLKLANDEFKGQTPIKGVYFTEFIIQ
jgi:flagellar basal body-associated protein FliL